MATPGEHTARRASPEVFFFVLCVIFVSSCGGTVMPLPSSSPSPVAHAQCSAATYDSSLPFAPKEAHAFVVVEENASFDSVLGNPNMPYVNSLAHNYAYAEGYFANAHPSAPNYFMLTTGQEVTVNDEIASTVTDDNMVRHLLPAGKNWKEYSQDLPAVGYVGPDSNFYIQHHNPLSYFSDVRNDPAQLLNLVDFSQFFKDLDAHALPNYAFIVPDNTHDAHGCLPTAPNCTEDQKLAVADQWLRDNIDPLVQSPDFNQPGGGVLIITFDESRQGDNQKHGGHVFWMVVGVDVKKGYVSSTCYQHESTLRFMSQVLGLPNAPGAAATAPDMREFLTGN